MLIFSLLATFLSAKICINTNKARSVLPDRLISGAAAVYAELKKRWQAL
ncbi:hypothetical protein PO124_09395 [Bacillus licheniformis]|nr:hypothetical protein [Bacillus licheniformis]